MAPPGQPLASAVGACVGAAAPAITQVCCVLGNGLPRDRPPQRGIALGCRKRDSLSVSPTTNVAVLGVSTNRGRGSWI
jgi:hypothetical protein